jgi:hypothetical protein
VFVDNTGELTVGGIDLGVTGVSSTTGSINITASSLLTVNEKRREYRRRQHHAGSNQQQQR